MPPFDDVTARGGGSVDLTGHEMLVVNSTGLNHYQKGDIVVVRPYLWPWQQLEDPEERKKMADAGITKAMPGDRFVILRAPNAAFSENRHLGAGQHDSEGNLVSKSRFQVDLANLPSDVQTALDDKGKADVEFQAAGTPHIKDKEKGTGVNDVAPV